jgi:hypothetical protein
MKNIALIKSIVATSISSANPAELTEHIAALIQAHPVDQVELTCNGSYNHDDYVIAREKAYENSTSVTFDIREWNTGKVVWKR